MVCEQLIVAVCVCARIWIEQWDGIHTELSNYWKAIGVLQTSNPFPSPRSTVTNYCA